MQQHEKMKLLGLLGIARKAQKTVLGTELVTQAVREGRCRLVLCASDISANTEKRLSQCCIYYGVMRVVTDISMDELSHACGKASAVAAVAVTDRGFADALLRYFPDTPANVGSSIVSHPRGGAGQAD